MKKLFIGGIASVVLSTGSAVAADMLLKAPPPVVYSWTGCYIGANGGYAWNNGESSYHDPNATADPINGVPTTMFPVPPLPSATIGTIPTPTNTKGSGWIGGGEVGCNWQTGRGGVVLGFETDIDALGVSGSAATVGPTATGSLAGSPPTQYVVGPSSSLGLGTAGTANEQVSLRWLSTIRARAGVPVISDRGLLFLTGGLAIAEVSSSGSVNISQPAFPGVGPENLAWGGSNSTTLIGYTVGGGLEYALTDHWTAKTEYLYYNVGTVSHPLSLNVIQNSTGAPNSTFYQTLGNTVSSVSGSIIRVGLNYRFNWGPVVASY